MLPKFVPLNGESNEHIFFLICLTLLWDFPHGFFKALGTEQNGSGRNGHLTGEV